MPLPANLRQVSSTPASVTIAWDPVPGAVRYRISGYAYDPMEPFPDYDNVVSPFTIHPPVQPGRGLVVRVHAYNAAGQALDPIDGYAELQVWFGMGDAKNIVVASTPTTVSANWEWTEPAPSTWGNTRLLDINGNQLAVKTSANMPAIEYGASPDLPLASGTPFFIELQRINPSYPIDPGNKFQAYVVTGIDAPNLDSASVVDNGVDPVGVVGHVYTPGGAFSLRIWRDDQIVGIQESPGNEFSFFDNNDGAGLAPGVYEYRAQYFNQYTDGTKSVPITVTVQAPPPPPAVPGVVSVENGTPGSYTFSAENAATFEIRADGSSEWTALPGNTWTPTTVGIYFVRGVSDQAVPGPENNLEVTALVTDIP